MPTPIEDTLSRHPLPAALVNFVRAVHADARPSPMQGPTLQRYDEVRRQMTTRSQGLFARNQSGDGGEALSYLVDCLATDSGDVSLQALLHHQTSHHSMQCTREHCIGPVQATRPVLHPHFDFHLRVPPNTSFQAAAKQYWSPHQQTHPNLAHCSSCNQNSCQQILTRLVGDGPPALWVTLSRLTQSQVTQDMDITPDMRFRPPFDNQASLSYRLHGLILHMPEENHYTCLIRFAQGWTLCDDARSWAAGDEDWAAARRFATTLVFVDVNSPSNRHALADIDARPPFQVQVQRPTRKVSLHTHWLTNVSL